MSLTDLKYAKERIAGLEAEVIAIDRALKDMGEKVVHEANRREKAESEYLEQAKRADEQMERCMKAEATIKEFRAACYKPPDENICLNCGRLTPCKLHREETAGEAPGEWPGSPCTFDFPMLAEMRERAEDALEVCRDIIAVVESDGAMSVQGIYEVIEKAKAALDD